MALFIIRQVEAWAGPEEGLWDYNNVFVIGEMKTKAKNERKAFTAYLKRKGVTFKKNRTLIEFDGDNYTIIDRKTKEPLFDAIWYG